MSTMGSGTWLSWALTKRSLSCGVGISWVVLTRERREDMSIMPILAASRMSIPSMTATNDLPVRLISTYVSE